MFANCETGDSPFSLLCQSVDDGTARKIYTALDKKCARHKSRWFGRKINQILTASQSQWNFHVVIDSNSVEVTEIIRKTIWKVDIDLLESPSFYQDLQ